MSLGENLQFLRKKENMTQEQLAEALEVSRQSVSKWESDTTYPETDKLLQMTKMFHCTLDDLMQKDISTQYVEDKANYDKFQNSFSVRAAMAVGFILSGLSIAAFLSAIFPQSGQFEALSGIVFSVFLVIAIAIFIVTGLQRKYFEEKNPYIENFYTEQEKEAFYKKYITLTTTGVMLIIIGIISIMALETILPNEVTLRSFNIDIEMLETGVFFLFITAAVCILVYTGTQKRKYDINRYNEMHNHTSAAYKKRRKIGIICRIIMLTATILFLILGFTLTLWQSAAVIYSVGGIMCGIAAIIVKKCDI